MNSLLGEIDSNAATIEKQLIALKGYIVSFRIEAEFNTRLSATDDEYNEKLFKDHGISSSKSKLKVDHYNDEYHIAYMEYTNAGFILTEIAKKEEETLQEKLAKEPQNKELQMRYKHFLGEMIDIDKMRIDRQLDVHCHDTHAMYIYSRQISAAVTYLAFLEEVIFEYWKKEPGYFVENDWKIERIRLLRSCADELHNKCFVSKEINSDSVIYEFKGAEYSVSKEQKEDINLLALEMASNWYQGIRWIMADDEDRLGKFIEKAYGFGSDELLIYKEYKRELINVNRRDIEQNLECNMSYMELIYALNPNANAIYWRGERYSESYFASLVLWKLVRHARKYGLRNKIETLLYRIIDPLKTWREIDSIDVDIPDMCRRGILSSYYAGKEDINGEQIAKKFEKEIIYWNNIGKDAFEIKRDGDKDKVSWNIPLNENSDESKRSWSQKYDIVIDAILDLTAFMKEKSSYILPVPKGMEGLSLDDERKKTDELGAEGIVPNYDTFENPEAFRDYFESYVSSHTVDESYNFMTKIRFDTNLRWWLDNYSRYSEI